MAVPADTPLTTPFTTVALDASLVLHTPLTVASVKVVVDPEHTEAVPVIPDTTGTSFTVTIVVYIVPGLQPGDAVPSVTVRE